VGVPAPLIIAAGLFVSLVLLERLIPDRAGCHDRWFTNLGWGAITMATTRVASFMAPLAVAVWAERAGFGLLNQFALPGWATAAIVIILMDCAVYWQHRMFHIIPAFWRWHLLHHRDEAMDVTTGVRFHPVEGLISLAWKSACVAVLGAPVWTVPLFELWLMAGSLIEHSNVRLPNSLDRAIRHVFVTPAMHRIHHSAHDDDAHHNFGFAIAVWDRVFGSLRADPRGERIGPPLR
jgi:sterol desaturase/sphingolipid hydroxylase (fatty acid hydroxylase superfamily)